ncbi:MAG: hypothetical protein KDA55_19320, partial [Planctomycetales bacterium]|nr:hypothetical protein [Planctomycetales bacterium]
MATIEFLTYVDPASFKMPDSPFPTTVQRNRLLLQCVTPVGACRTPEARLPAIRQLRIKICE